MTTLQNLLIPADSVDLYARHVAHLERLEQILWTLVAIVGAWAAVDLLLGILNALGASRRARGHPGDAEDLARGAAALATSTPPEGDGGAKLAELLEGIAQGKRAPRPPSAACLKCGRPWGDLALPTCGSCGASTATVAAGAGRAVYNPKPSALTVPAYPPKGAPGPIALSPLAAAVLAARKSEAV